MGRSGGGKENKFEKFKIFENKWTSCRNPRTFLKTREKNKSQKSKKKRKQKMMKMKKNQIKKITEICSSVKDACMKDLDGGDASRGGRPLEESPNARFLSRSCVRSNKRARIMSARGTSSARSLSVSPSARG